jgi:tRNA1(Val) A37 N6-methylase TrmN6
LEPKRVKIVYSHDDSEGEFILAEGRKGGREALKVLPPLFIYERTGEYSRVMTDIFSDLADRERIPQAPPGRRR